MSWNFHCWKIRHLKRKKKSQEFYIWKNSIIPASKMRGSRFFLSIVHFEKKVKINLTFWDINNQLLLWWRWNYPLDLAVVTNIILSPFSSARWVYFHLTSSLLAEQESANHKLTSSLCFFSFLGNWQLLCVWEGKENVFLCYSSLKYEVFIEAPALHFIKAVSCVGHYSLKRSIFSM